MITFQSHNCQVGVATCLQFQYLEGRKKGPQEKAS